MVGIREVRWMINCMLKGVFLVEIWTRKCVIAQLSGELLCEVLGFLELFNYLLIRSLAA